MGLRQNGPRLRPPASVSTRTGGQPLMSKRQFNLPRKRKENIKPPQAEDNSVQIGAFTFSGDLEPQFLAAMKSEIVAQHQLQKKKSKRSHKKPNSGKRNPQGLSRKKVVATLTEL